MLQLNRCPRCNGAFNKGEDNYGHFHNCLQCGYYLDSYDSEALGEALRRELVKALDKKRTVIVSR